MMNKNPVSQDFSDELAHELIHQHTKIESWFREEWRHSKPSLTCSVDIRNAGFKISPVDANLFPAGFNNLNPAFYSLGVQAFQSLILDRYPSCQNILIIPENITRNIYYYESLYVLQTFIKQAGYHVVIGSWLVNQTTSIDLSQGRKLFIQPLKRQENYLYVEKIKPCLILLNNDLSECIPDFLLNIEQPIEPCPELGWSTRRKMIHFDCYQKICQKFSTVIHLDEWKISRFYRCAEHFEELDTLVESLFNEIEQKYKQYHIHSSPFVIIKPDAGTYGRGVFTLRSVEEVKKLNKKQRQNLLMQNSPHSHHRIFIQEGIPTIEKMENPPSLAEPVIYLLGQYVIGGFYRFHPSKKDDESLNSPGMQFKPLPFTTCCNEPNAQLGPNDPLNRFYIYSVIARLSLLATCLEKNIYCEKT